MWFDPVFWPPPDHRKPGICADVKAADEKTVGAADVPLTATDMLRLMASEGAVWIRGQPYRVIRVVSLDGTWRATVCRVER